MNNILPAIIYCPNCEHRKDSVDMGSVNSDGYLILLRKFGRHTLVMAEAYSIICDCGYYIRIENGKITSSSPTALTMNG